MFVKRLLMLKSSWPAGSATISLVREPASPSMAAMASHLCRRSFHPLICATVWKCFFQTSHSVGMAELKAETFLFPPATAAPTCNPWIAWTIWASWLASMSSTSRVAGGGRPLAAEQVPNVCEERKHRLDALVGEGLEDRESKPAL